MHDTPLRMTQLEGALAEAGGHPGMDMIGSMVQGATVPAALDVPVVLAGGMGSGAQLVAGVRDGQAVQVAHQSTTFGTAKNPSRASGALARTLAC